MNQETKDKISKTCKERGIGKWMEGRTLSQVTRDKMSLRTPWNKGKKGLQTMSESGKERTRQRMLKRTGSANPGWKGGITPIRIKIWFSREYRNWRTNIFRNDNYTCVNCGDHSGNGKAVILEADHHPIPFAQFMQEVKEQMPSNLYEALISYQPLWNAEGRTLCRPCHDLTKKGRATLKAKEDEKWVSKHQ